MGVRVIFFSTQLESSFWPRMAVENAITALYKFALDPPCSQREIALQFDVSIEWKLETKMTF